MPPHQRRRFLTGVALGLGLTALTGADAARAGTPTLCVRDVGARGDGVTRDTVAIQAAVDAVAARGGGTVVVPPGRFLTGTITLRSWVTLHLAEGAVLLGSSDPADYPGHHFLPRDLDVGGHTIWALLRADGAEHVTIEGDGVIDGQGGRFPRVPVRDPEVPTSVRPRLIYLHDCRSVGLRGVTLREGGLWTVHLALCDAVRITGLHVASGDHLNQDGIVLDSCRDAVVSDCDVDTEDDAVVLKSSFPRACSDVTVRDCTVRSRCAGMKLGTQSLGGFRRVAISGCRFHDCRLGGLKLQTVDGGDLEDVTVRDLVMDGVAAPISVRRGDRGFDYDVPGVTRPRPVGRLRRVTISRVRATVPLDVPPDGRTMSIAGLPAQPVEDVVLEGVHVTLPGGGTVADARRTGIPELANAYPEHTMFGVLPAYGLWVRHAARISVRDLRLDVGSADARPAVVGDDVDGLDVTGLALDTV